MANVAFILNRFPDGGIERVTINLARPLVEECGHHLFLFVHELQEQNLPETLPVTYIQLPYESWNVKNKKMLENAIVEHDIDIVFSPMVAEEHIYNLREKGLCKIAYVFHGHPFYEVKETKWYMDNKPCTSISKWLKKYLLTIPKFWLGYYDRKVAQRYKKVYHNVDAFGTLFDKYSQTIAEAIGVKDIDNSKFCSLQNPTQQKALVLSENTRKKQLLYVGRLSRRDKRVDRLLMVWNLICKNYPDWQLTIVGDGDDKDNLVQMTAELQLPRVEFYGFMPNPEELYLESEILCLTSDFEGCPMVLLEAQQCGCATMAFNCSSGIEEIISPNWECGVYVPNGDIEAYAEALGRLMSDEVLRGKIQKNGIENVERFSVNNSVHQYNALIEKLMR